MNLKIFSFKTFLLAMVELTAILFGVQRCPIFASFTTSDFLLQNTTLYIPEKWTVNI